MFLAGAVVPVYIAFGLIRLTGFRTITRYEPNDSFYYTLNPTTKIVALFIIAVSTTMASLYLGLAMTGVILASYASLVDGRNKLWIGFLFTVAVVWANVWGTVSQRISILLSAQGFAPFELARFYAEQARLVGTEVAASGVFLFALILVMTSTPSSVVRALREVKMPNALAFSLVVGMKSVPLLFEVINSIVKVQFMRGFGTRGSNWLGPLYTIVAVLLALIPSLIFLLRNARNIAISTGTRAFGAYKTRTYMSKPPFGAADLIVIALAAAFLSSTVLL